MNIPRPELVAQLKARLAQDKVESQNLLPLKTRIQQVEAELNQHTIKWCSLIDQNDPAVTQQIDESYNEIKRCSDKIKDLTEKYDVSLERLWDGDFPDITFISNCTPSISVHTSKYSSVTVDGLLTIPNSIHIQPQNLSRISTFIDSFNKKKWKCSYLSEADICSKVKLLLEDILTSLDLHELIDITSEATFGGTRSDVWFLKTEEGIPFLPIEIKKPLTPLQSEKRIKRQQPEEFQAEEEVEEEVEEEEKNTVEDEEQMSLMSDSKVIGQCYHYMQQLRSSFGQEVVYGIITNLEDWRILCLQNVSIDNTTSSSSSSTTDILSTSSSMTVTASSIYSLHRKVDLQQLLCDIANSINVSYKSPYVSVPLLSPKRGYIVLQDDIFYWGNITPSVLNNHPNITFNVPEQSDELAITILRTFKGGADGHVYLGLTQNFDLVVVKKFIKNDDQGNAYNNELKYWLKINEKAAVPLGITKQTLVLPFAFHCQQDENGTSKFDFNLNKWGSSTTNYIGDKRFTDLSNLFQNVYDNNPISLKNALMSAVEKFALKNCVHEDIEWRHVALLPQILIENNVEIPSLTPILIDLSRVKEVTDFQTAINEMSTNVKKLLGALPPESSKSYEQQGEARAKRARPQPSLHQTHVEGVDDEVAEEDEQKQMKKSQSVKKQKVTGERL